MSNVDLVFAAAALWLGWKIFSRLQHTGTTLRGPASLSYIFGMSRLIAESDDPGALYETWANQYGSTYRVSRGLGVENVVICDPKAATHILSKETFGYVQTKSNQLRLQRFFGRGILASEGESHRRQRKALTPGFSNSSIRKLTDVFYDAAYKCKIRWESILENSPDGIIEVQSWMSYISLDSMGIAAFSTELGALDGNDSEIAKVFEAFTVVKNTFFAKVTVALMQMIPWAVYLPTPINRQRMKLNGVGTKIAEELIARDKIAVAEGDSSDKSVLGLLLKSERATSEHLRTSREEIITQINTLWVAGYETSSTTLSWALIELSKNQDVQAKLRAELSQFTDSDPGWDELIQLPYLEGVIQETLRLHPAVPELQKEATEDDILPLCTPARLSNGQETSSLSISKGTIINIPVTYMNKAYELWGPTAKDFDPDRWTNIEDSDLKAKEIRGHRHVLSFSSGVRICLGMNFALAEMKAVLFVLIKNFSFEFPGGKDTQITLHQSLVKRPKVVGTDGAHVPLIVRKLEE